MSVLLRAQAVGAVLVLFWMSWRLAPVLAGRCCLASTLSHPWPGLKSGEWLLGSSVQCPHRVCKPR